MAIDVMEVEQTEQVRVFRWNVREMLNERGMKSSHFGFQAHIFPAALSAFLKGTPKQVGVKTLLRMKNVLNCSLDDLLVEEVVTMQEARARGFDEDDWVEV